MVDALTVHAGDSVGTLLRDSAAGETIDADGLRVMLAQNVPRGHKIARSDRRRRGRH